MQILHTMIRVGDLKRSVAFYTEALGMKLLRTSENPEYKYSLAFVGYGDEAHHSVIELTYNWDTSSYDQGNAFGHIAIGVDDIYAFCDNLKNKGIKILREAGPVKGGKTVIAFIEDPDGYKIELIELSQSAHGLG